MPSETPSALRSRGADCTVLGMGRLPSHTASSGAAGVVVVNAITAARLRSYANCEYHLLCLLGISGIGEFVLNWKVGRVRYRFSFLAKSGSIPLWAWYYFGEPGVGWFWNMPAILWMTAQNSRVFFMVIIISSLVYWHSKNLCVFLWIRLFWNLKGNHALTKWDKMVILNASGLWSFWNETLKITGYNTPGDSGPVHTGTKPVLYSKEIYSVF